MPDLTQAMEDCIHGCSVLFGPRLAIEFSIVTRHPDISADLGALFGLPRINWNRAPLEIVCPLSGLNGQKISSNTDATKRRKISDPRRIKAHHRIIFRFNLWNKEEELQLTGREKRKQFQTGGNTKRSFPRKYKIRSIVGKDSSIAFVRAEGANLPSTTGTTRSTMQVDAPEE